MLYWKVRETNLLCCTWRERHDRQRKSKDDRGEVVAAAAAAAIEKNVIPGSRGVEEFKVEWDRELDVSVYIARFGKRCDAFACDDGSALCIPAHVGTLYIGT